MSEHYFLHHEPTLHRLRISDDNHKTIYSRDYRALHAGAGEHFEQVNAEMREIVDDLNRSKARKTFIERIARMNYDGEILDETMGGERVEFIMENDDAVDTLNALIGEARELTGGDNGKSD